MNDFSTPSTIHQLTCTHLYLFRSSNCYLFYLFIIVDEAELRKIKGDLLFWTTVSLTKVLSFRKEIAKEILLCINNNNISMKQALCILFSALSCTGFFQSDASKYWVNLTFYLANFGSQKYLNLKQAYFMARDIDLVGGKPFLTNLSYMNKGKIKFLQITQDIMRQTCCQNISV